MSISHFKSNIIPDVVGTVIVLNSNGATTTVNATQLVRPSDWNSVHVQNWAFGGNTAGVSSGSGSDLIFAGGDNITLSAVGSTVSIIGVGTASAMNTSQSSLFQQISNTSAITSAAFPSAQTTKFAGTGTTFAGANITGAMTLNSDGLNLALTGGAGSGGGSPVAFSASGGSSGFSTLSFSNQNNGVTFSNSIGQLALSHSLQQLSNTSAITSNAVNTSVSSLFQQISNTSAITSNAVNTSVSSLFQQTSATSAITSNAVNASVSSLFQQVSATSAITSNAVNTSVSSLFFQTSASSLFFQTSASSLFFQTSASSLFQQISNTSAITSNAVNASVSSLFQQTSATSAITAAAFPSAQTTKFAGTGYTSTTTAGLTPTVTLNTSGLSMAWPAFITTYVAQTTQTQAAGNIAGAGYTSTTTAGLTPTVTLNTSGLSMAWPAFITTYASQTNQTVASGGIAGTNTTFAGTNISGSMTLNSNGLNLALSAAAGGGTGGDGYNIIQISGNTAGTANTFLSGTMVIAGGANITLSQSSNTISIIGAAAGTGAFAGTGYTSTTTAGLTPAVTLNTSGLSMAWPSFITTYSQTVPAYSYQVQSGAAVGTSTYTTSGPLQFLGEQRDLSFVSGLGGVIGLTHALFATSISSRLVATSNSSLFVLTNPSDTLGALYLPQDKAIANLSAHINGTMSIQNMLLEAPRSATQLVVPINISSVATNNNSSSAAINFSVSLVVYREFSNILSSTLSTTFTRAGTWSSNATGSVTGGVFLTAPFNMTLSKGLYYFGVNISTAATGGVLTGATTTSLGNTISIVGVNTAQFGLFSWREIGQATASSLGWAEQGLYSNTTNIAGPISMAHVSMAGTAGQRANFALQFVGSL